MDNGRYKAVFIDFYGTIAGGDAEAVERACAHLIADRNLSISARSLAVAWGERFFATIDACRANGFRNLYRCECESLVDTCRPLCGPIDPTPYVDELFAYMRQPPLHADACAALASSPLPVCCVSNADTAHLHDAMAHHGLSFDGVVCSEDVRAYKPDAAVFERALDLVGCAASEVVHVGDSLHSDVSGARAAGIDAVWVCRDQRIHDVGTGHADYKISSLMDLWSVLT